jgi:hypothetical protein
MPNGHKIYQNLPLQEFPKFTKIGIFGLKTNHMATLFCYVRLIVGGRVTRLCDFFAYWVIVYFEQGFENYKICPNCWATFFPTAKVMD